ncbi:MAG TPA: PilZ domain-containing protein [Elusimicrobiota bacterium]|nr:PilZ domain-containing protein [Elusimicrobiota bacterium]HMU95810.1 PilZ domain-containing protein [Elusimicrobiota bacterium]HMZ27896.1 PilZ domain-containing protein [Elusimicrobiota bacterium]HNA61353.1 PilZ domain-containing protein [Elusimicrobiota bacterium]HNC73338.1 PilZ domain-containing protein [Elusimicrobiota bacterium]
MKPDNRRHKRFPVLKDMAEPVDLFVMDQPPREVPAVLTNLSAGGMALVVFAHVSGDAKLKILLDVHGLENLELQGRVAWTEVKGDTTAIGVRFDHLSHDTVHRITKMAEDFQDCELKISFGLKDVCFRQCAYWTLCGKPVKLKH